MTLAFGLADGAEVMPPAIVGRDDSGVVEVCQPGADVQVNQRKSRPAEIYPRCP